MQKPVIFLDFDRTLFDTAQFYDWLGKDVETALEALLEGRVEEPNFASMLYSDTLSFLERTRHSHRLVLLTYTMNTPLQEKKINGSGITPYFDHIIMTHGTREGESGKGVGAKEYLATYHSTGKNIFIDDALANITEVKRINPEIRCVRIARTISEGMETDRHTSRSEDCVVANLSAVFPLL